MAGVARNGRREVDGMRHQMKVIRNGGLTGQYFHACSEFLESIYSPDRAESWGSMWANSPYRYRGRTLTTFASNVFQPARSRIETLVVVWATC